MESKEKGNRATDVLKARTHRHKHAHAIHTMNTCAPPCASLSFSPVALCARPLPRVVCGRARKARKQPHSSSGFFFDAGRFGDGTPEAQWGAQGERRTSAHQGRKGDASARPRDPGERYASDGALRAGHKHNSPARSSGPGCCRSQSTRFPRRWSELSKGIQVRIGKLMRPAHERTPLAGVLSTHAWPGARTRDHTG
jgi:hypothetical protein